MRIEVYKDLGLCSKWHKDKLLVTTKEEINEMFSDPNEIILEFIKLAVNSRIHDKKPWASLNKSTIQVIKDIDLIFLEDWVKFKIQDLKNVMGENDQFYLMFEFWGNSKFYNVGGLRTLDYCT